MQPQNLEKITDDIEITKLKYLTRTQKHIIPFLGAVWYNLLPPEERDAWKEVHSPRQKAELFVNEVVSGVTIAVGMVYAIQGVLDVYSNVAYELSKLLS